MNKEPLISVITVCYNALPSLQKTAASVWAQQCAQYEYLIIDGGSTDGTVTWMEQLTEDQARWISEADHGIYDAMNKGVSMAKGEWLIFMNAGDQFIAPETLQTVLPYLQEPYGLVYGDIKREYKGQLQERIAEEPRNAHRMFFCHQALFTKRELLRICPFDIRHRYSADFAFVKSQIKQKSAMLHIPHFIAIFDMTGASNQNVNAGLADNLSVIREMDTWQDRLRFCPRLLFKIYWNKLRKIAH